MRHVHAHVPRQLAFFVFAYFDENDDGHLDYHELQQISHAMEGSRFGGDMAKFLGRRS